MGARTMRQDARRAKRTRPESQGTRPFTVGGPRTRPFTVGGPRTRPSAVSAYLGAVDMHLFDGGADLSAVREALEGVKMAQEDGVRTERDMSLSSHGQALVLRRLRGMDPDTRVEFLRTLRGAKRLNSQARPLRMTRLSAQDLEGLEQDQSNAPLREAMQRSRAPWLNANGCPMAAIPLLGAQKAGLSTEPHTGAWELGVLEGVQHAATPLEAIRMLNRLAAESKALNAQSMSLRQAAVGSVGILTAD